MGIPQKIGNPRAISQLCFIYHPELRNRMGTMVGDSKGRRAISRTRRADVL